jgi:hypothetical protein
MPAAVNFGAQCAAVGQSDFLYTPPSSPISFLLISRHIRTHHAESILMSSISGRSPIHPDPNVPYRCHLRPRSLSARRENWENHPFSARGISPLAFCIANDTRSFTFLSASPTFDCSLSYWRGNLPFYNYAFMIIRFYKTIQFLSTVVYPHLHSRKVLRRLIKLSAPCKFT